MQHLLEHHEIMMAQYLERFPLPAHEAERRIAADEAQLLTCKLPLPPLEAILSEVHAGRIGAGAPLDTPLVWRQSGALLSAVKTPSVCSALRPFGSSAYAIRDASRVLSAAGRESRPNHA